MKFHDKRTRLMTFQVVKHQEVIYTAFPVWYILNSSFAASSFMPACGSIASSDGYWRSGMSKPRCRIYSCGPMLSVRQYGCVEWITFTGRI